MIVDRISREGFILSNARLTLSLMAQPSVISRFMGKRGDEARGTGFLARFLVAKPTPMAGKRKDIQLSDLPRQKTFNARIRERLTFVASSERQTLSFSEKAKDKWFEYSHHIEQQMQQNGIYHYMKDHASKLMENTSRLAAILHTFERKSENEKEIDLATLEFCWKFSQNCSNHFIKHLANEPQIVTDTNLLAHYLLMHANKHDPLAEKREATPNSPYLGITTRVSLTHLKQYGPSALRGRANSERLDAAIELLRKLGHIAKEGGFYKFSESILLIHGEPDLKNGQNITIKELPLFSEQIFDRSKSGSHSAFNMPRYLISPN